MTFNQRKKVQILLEKHGWIKHQGISGSYWTNSILGKNNYNEDKCFSGSIEDLIDYCIYTGIAKRYIFS